MKLYRRGLVIVITCIITAILLIIYVCLERNQQFIPIPLNLSEANICDKLYDKSRENSTLLVVPRRAYYDNRNAWKPGKGNVVVVLTEMSDLALGTFVACEINGHITYEVVDDLREDTKWVRSQFKGLTYSMVCLFCLFVPQDVIVNGASVKLIHKNKNDSCYSRVESEFPLVVKTDNSEGITFARGPNSVLVCVTVYKRPPYFNEWLKYQKHLGVDMVHINADPSFTSNATSQYPFLKEGLTSGFAVMEEWKNPLGKKMFYYSELIKYQDCVMKYLGEFQYAFMLDADDFFNPVLPDHKDVHYYVGQFFKNSKIATKLMKWLDFCNCPDLSKVRSDGNLTALVEEGKTKPSGARKAVHELSKLLFVNIHNAHTVVKGYYVDRRTSPMAYVSHIRPIKKC